MVLLLCYSVSMFPFPGEILRIKNMFIASSNFDYKSDVLTTLVQLMKFLIGIPVKIPPFPFCKFSSNTM